MFSQAREEITVVETFQSSQRRRARRNGCFRRLVSIRRDFLVRGEGIANSHVTFGRVNALVK